MGSHEWSFLGKGYPDNSSLMPLLKFYVLECPVRGVSRRGRDFDALGWSGPAFCTLKKKMLADSSLINDRWVQLEDKGDLDALLREWGQYERPSFEFEFAAYKKTGKYKVEGLYYLIRNAFAHGSFYSHTVKGDGYYVFENRKGKDLKGRAVLKESTLRSWKAAVLSQGRR